METSEGCNMGYKFDKTPITGQVGNYLGQIRLVKVDETKLEAFWGALVDEYHYLGYDWQFGGRVKYLIVIGKQPVGAIGFCSAAYKLGPRDQYLGWDEATRLAQLPHLVNNNRLLILPWVTIKNLASYVLSLGLKHLRADWKKQYEVEPFMVETFVDRQRYSGTCYKAANWIYLGVTQGYGKQGNTFVYHGQKKDIYVKIMNRRFSSQLKPSLEHLHQSIRKEILAMINGVPMWYPSVLDAMGIANFNIGTVSGLLADHLATYVPYLGRKEHIRHLTTMVQGHLSDLERKSNEPIAIAFSGVGSVRNVANFMNKDQWEEAGMLEAYQKEAGKLLFHPEGMITGDGCDFPKKGKHSVGVQRQYCGQRGKTDNCQASVMAGYAGPLGYTLLDYELYMPEAWFDDAHKELRKKCGVPGALEFKTKNQLLSESIQKIAGAEGFEGKYVGVDSSFGNDKDFLDALPENLIYFADIHSNCLVYRGRPEMHVPEYSGKGKKPKKEKPSFLPIAVKTIAEDGAIPWNDVVLGIGAKGPIITKDKCVPVVEVRDEAPGKDVWLYIRKLEDGSIKYALCNETMDATIADVRKPALMRWAIEQCFNECKKHLGMDHNEVRTWHGWRRHMLITFLSHLFVAKLRKQLSVKPHAPGVAPYIDAPVPLSEYLDAVKKLEQNAPIKNPHIMAVPDKPQQIMTIGLILDIVASFMTKIGEIWLKINFKLKNIADSFNSHTNSRVNKAMEEYDAATASG
jgi:SRSO17 transposase